MMMLMSQATLDSTIFYDDNDVTADCEDCDNEIDAYEDDADDDYEASVVEEDSSGETISELYQYCLAPSVYDTVKYLLPLLLSCILFRILTQNRYSSPQIFHGLSVAVGLYTLRYYIPECLCPFVLYVVALYASLRLPSNYRSGMRNLLPSLFLILYCEYSMVPAAWHKVRGVVMIAATKGVSLGADVAPLDKIPNILEYLGYMLGGANVLFGPWISFKDYLALGCSQHRNPASLRWIVTSARFFLLSLFFLSVSNCWAQWMLTDRAGKWFVAYRDAFAFRSSHYFVAYATSSILVLSGYPQSLASIARPLEIELPRSLVQVVVSWNVPMHTWLKLYIFRPARRRLGKFNAVLLTYLTSALVHGFNFQLAAVLLSLGLYTFVEYQLRNVLAETFDACVAAKKCCEGKCPHARKSINCWWVVATNFAFTALTIFHLAYLGLMFDTSEIQETGYSYAHTIDKWSQLGFASHWVAFATYLAYFLIR